LLSDSLRHSFVSHDTHNFHEFYKRGKAEYESREVENNGRRGYILADDFSEQKKHDTS
jgi:hypothetical protein